LQSADWKNELLLLLLLSFLFFIFILYFFLLLLVLLLLLLFKKGRFKLRLMIKYHYTATQNVRSPTVDQFISMTTSVSMTFHQQ